MELLAGSGRRRSASSPDRWNHVCRDHAAHRKRDVGFMLSLQRNRRHGIFSSRVHGSSRPRTLRPLLQFTRRLSSGLLPVARRRAGCKRLVHTCRIGTVSRIRESLATPSAKAWLAEHGKEIDRKCPGCQGEWSSGAAGPPDQAEIHNGAWEAASGQNAEWGRKAPYLTKLRVMGGFLSDRLHELVPHNKRFRAYDIHRYGWS
jgi:hypothetical protein